MTLEKLLIFGFAIAVATALATSGQSIAEKRKPENVTYQKNITALVKKTQ